MGVQRRIRTGPSAMRPVEYVSYPGSDGFDATGCVSMVAAALRESIYAWKASSFFCSVKRCTIFAFTSERGALLGQSETSAATSRNLSLAGRYLFPNLFGLLYLLSLCFLGVLRPQRIGSSRSQTRNPYVVINHINFSMMAATIIWIYGSRLENIPEHRHKVKGRTVSPSQI